MRPNKIVLAGLIALSVAGLSACGSSSGGSGGNGTTVRIGNVASGGQDLPAYVAYAKGYFKAQGLNVKYTPANSPVLAQGLAGGSLDFATLPSGSLLSANAAGSNLVMIASIANTPPTALYAPKSISSPADLAGKKVAVGNVGTASYVEAQVLLDKYQMGKKVTLTSVSGSGPGILAALKQNLVQAGAFSPPVALQATNAGYHDLIDGATSKIDYVSGGIVVKQSYVKAHPDTVKKVATAMAAAWKFMGNPANKAAVITLLAKDMGLSQADAAAGYPQLFPIWSSQPTPAVSATGMATAIKYSPDAIKKGLKASDQFDNSYLPSSK